MLDAGFYNMDCMDGMAQLESNSIDLIITSPPYNLGNQHHTGNNGFTPYASHDDDMPEADYQAWQIDVLKECGRVLKDDGSIFYNHKNRIKDGITITPYLWLLKTGLFLKQELVWFNGSQNFDKCRFYPMTERVYWLQTSVKTKFNNAINHHDLFDWAAVGAQKEHKRAFPLTMVKDILACFPSGLTVLDPFSGSGTVGVACHDCGDEFIGFEIDKGFYNAATERLNKVKAQVSMAELVEKPTIDQIKII